MFSKVLAFIQFLLMIISFNYQKLFLKKEVDIRLTIPSISLNQVLYEKEDERNKLEERLIFLKSSSTPEIKGGNVIIAGHSGYGNIAYFKDLYKIKIKDDIFLTYHGKKYQYEVVRKYKVPKTGEVEVIRDPNDSSITLITCYGSKEQLVVIGKQKKVT